MKWAAVLVTVACSSRPAPRELPSNRQEPTGPVVLELEAPTPAPWLEPEAEDGANPLANAWEIAVGARRGLVRPDNRALYAIDLDRGASGPLELPDPETVKWIGIGGIDDQLFILREDGKLYRSASVSDFKVLVELGPFPDIQVHSAAPGLVVLASRNTLHVSTDGAKFVTVKPPVDRVDGVFARSDGVLVVQGKTGRDRTLITMITRDRKKWVRSRLQPPSTLWHVGAWIRTDAQSCKKAVLSADGEHWVKLDDPSPVLRAAVSLGELLEHEPDRVAYGTRQYRTAIELPPPKFDPALEVTGPDAGNCRPSMVGGVNPGAAERRRLGRDLLASVRGAQREEVRSRTNVGILSDGVCSDGDADPKNKQQCRDGAKLVRAPHVALIDRVDNRALVLEPPAGCVPIATRAARGLPLVFCEGGETTQVYLLAKNGTWRDEGSHPGHAPFDDVQIAADGTLLVFPACDDQKPCRVWVRSPHGIGKPAWRTLDDGEIYRATTAGAVLVGVREETGPSFVRVAFYLDRPGRARDKLATARFDERLTAVEVVGHEVRIAVGKDDGRVLQRDGSLR